LRFSVKLRHKFDLDDCAILLCSDLLLLEIDQFVSFEMPAKASE
jgi:hypothetical protein